MEAGLSAHPGWDILDDSANDILSDSFMLMLVSLIFARVIRDWHFGLPCVSWGTLRRPRVRSEARPWGFDPSDPFTRYHNRIAVRVCWLMGLGDTMGLYASDEQPGASVAH